MNLRSKSLRNQSGLTTVEVAVVGMVLMVTIIGVLEVGRAFFVYNSLEEATRRGARMAAVCQPGAAAIAQIAVFNTSGSSGPSPLIADLETSNINVTYHDDLGAPVNPGTNYLDISYVRVAIVNFEHEMFVPFVGSLFNTPAFATTLPRESLGVTRSTLQGC